MNPLLPAAVGAGLGAWFGGTRGAAVGGAVGLGVGLLTGGKSQGSPGLLRDRALAVSLAEDARWGDQAPSVERIDEYLEGVDPHGASLVAMNNTGSIVNFCAAGVGWSEHPGGWSAARTGDNLPPWRSAAKQLMLDSQAGLRGPWHPVSHLNSGWRPPPGALAIYTRGDPEAFTGHVVRVVKVLDEDHFEGIGANEGGRKWSRSPRAFSSPALLGFVVDGEPPVKTLEFSSEALVDFVEPPLTDEELEVING